MPTLDFKGKPFVYSHHLSVPFRGLEIDDKKSMPGSKGPSLDDNLIIHGDNLHALKALLPKYAGKVDLIFIDPPYNTGNEKWVYNDSVNSPLMKSWLGETVDGEDLERHDKWLCMMWPRLTLLWQLLSDDGAMFITIDDNEYANLKSTMDEIAGADKFQTNFVWQSRYSVSNDSVVSQSHNYVLLYVKDKSRFKETRNKLDRTSKQSKQYNNPDKDPKGPWRAIPWDAPNIRKNLEYPIKTPSGDVRFPPKGRCWSRTEDEWLKIVDAGLSYFGQDGSGAPSFKRYLSEAGGVVPTTWWPHEDAGHTDEAKKELNAFNLDVPFETPKPKRLLERIIKIASTPESVILDSFAGSATTGHAVQSINKADGGNRKFILVETEDYANDLTAERMRRVIQGVKGAKDSVLANGLGGSFTFCKLGAPIDVDAFFGGNNDMPTYEQIASYIAYTATGEALSKPPKKPRKDWFIGEINGTRLHLIYKDDADFMKSGKAALTEDLAKKIAKSNSSGKTAYVFGAVKYLSQKELSSADYRIQFCQLPYSIYRIMGDAPGSE